MLSASFALKALYELTCYFVFYVLRNLYCNVTGKTTTKNLSAVQVLSNMTSHNLQKERSPAVCTAHPLDELVF